VGVNFKNCKTELLFDKDILLKTYGDFEYNLCIAKVIGGAHVEHNILITASKNVAFNLYLV
jgi:hypothetical protein